MGFFTDTTVCIGCKACEVACKQWNDLPADEHQPAGVATTTRARCRPRRGGTCASSRRSRSRDAPGADAEPGRGGAGRGAGPLAVHVRRLQALHERGLPGRVPDGRADPHRVRDRDRAAGRLQRLRLLRSVVPVRRDRPRPVRRARRQVHAVLRPAARTGWSRRARRRARPTRSSSGPTTSWSSGPRDAWRRWPSAGSRAPTCTAPGTGRATTWPAASARSSCSPSRRSVYGLPAQADSPSQQNGPIANATGVAASVVAIGVALASFAAAYRRRK